MTQTLRSVLQLLLAVVVLPSAAWSQASTLSKGSFDFNSDGVVFQSADSSTKVIMRFRMQNWAVYTTESMTEDSDLNLSAGSTELAVRRLRLRFGGSLIDPRLTFNLQLSFSRGDMDWNDTQFPNIIRDAMIFWNFNPNLQVGFGQTKLPGNRQRVISSADLEIADRSIVNAAFNIDRDFGFQAFWRPISGDQVVNLRAAISSGDGRNQPALPGGGLAYTARAEWLPLGAFTNGGDYFEGDLMRESSPKLSIGFTAHHNDNQTRTRGQLGTALYQRRSSDVLYGDVLFKYSGFSLYGEWAQRSSKDPLTFGTTSSGRKDSAAILVGNGWLVQTSYVFPSMWSVAARIAQTKGGDQLAGWREYATITNIGANVGHYFNRHRIKANLELGTNRTVDHNKADLLTFTYYTRFNVELGI